MTYALNYLPADFFLSETRLEKLKIRFKLTIDYDEQGKKGPRSRVWGISMGWHRKKNLLRVHVLKGKEFGVVGCGGLVGLSQVMLSGPSDGLWM